MNKSTPFYTISLPGLVSENLSYLIIEYSLKAVYLILHQLFIFQLLSLSLFLYSLIASVEYSYVHFHTPG
jgi:hypothetical protein